VALRMAEPARLEIMRNRKVSPPATRWALQTRSTALPCSLLADQLEVLAWMGDEATFQGSVAAMPCPDGWQGELSGRFSHVDLDQLVTERYNHKLSGTAEIVFHRARFRGGKLVDAAGEVTCSGGVVSWSLLDQAHKSLGLVADGRVRADEADALWQYEQLRFRFTLDGEGLRIEGRCGAPGEGIVMADRDGPLLTDRPQTVAQVVALVRALASESGQQVPVTPEAFQLLHVLPISKDREPVRVGPSPRIYSPLRLR